jgi:endonuclease/exonuclease/phosphatase (EEP) superfamily protein YafD
MMDTVLLAGESVLINERVKAPGDSVSWLRLKDGQGWVHYQDHDGHTVMVAHSLRHRKTVAEQQQQQQLTSPLLEKRLATHNENDDPHNADSGMKFTV